MAKIAILGCGFGTALAVLFDRYGHEVTAWSKFEDEIAAIQRDGEHRKLLPGVVVPPTIKFTTDISMVRDADIVMFVIPSKFVREVARSVKPYLSEKTILVNMGKGFESGLKRLSEVINEEIPTHPVVVVTGPCHAEEVGRLRPTTVVAASKDPKHSLYIQDVLQNERFRIYSSDDMTGCEIAAALKNPIALCCGIVEGMGYGDNTLAALMTRGLTEITRLGVAMGAKWQTFTGLAGVGDLIVTCTSTHSRNHRAGLLIGQGMPALEAVKKVGTVEGYGCTEIAYHAAMQLGVSIPIIEQLYQVCYENRNPKESVSRLMMRPSKHEKETFWDA
jgi:glycerol-3-phosphate dehydrogenase (NAD(P)+)